MGSCSPYSALTSFHSKAKFPEQPVALCSNMAKKGAIFTTHGGRKSLIFHVHTQSIISWTRHKAHTPSTRRPDDHPQRVLMHFQSSCFKITSIRNKSFHRPEELHATLLSENTLEIKIHKWSLDSAITIEGKNINDILLICKFFSMLKSSLLH